MIWYKLTFRYKFVTINGQNLINIGGIIMATRIFPTKRLELPIDVKKFSETIIHGNINGNANEIVVLKQLGREVFEDAFVCHITEGTWGIGIYDMQGFHFIKIGNKSIKEVDSLKFTMVSITEAIMPRSYMPTRAAKSNWLY